MKRIFLLSLFLATQAHATVIRGAGCARTAEIAVMHLLRHIGDDGVTHGYRVDAVRIDPLSKQRWAIVSDCSDPSRPRMAVLLSGSEPAAQELESSRVAVHIGEQVKVLSRDEDSAIQLVGAAMEGGAVGDRVRVRFATALGDASRTVECKVVGPGVVEMTR